MNLIKFDLPENEGDVILVKAIIEGKFVFRLALDTAATHTTIDSNVLYFSGYKLSNFVGEIELETSNGIINVDLYNIKNFDCLGIEKRQSQVQVYDFQAYGVNSNYDGVIGLSFL